MGIMKSSVTKISSWLFQGKEEESFESRNSWRWQEPPSSFHCPVRPSISTERNISNNSNNNTITRTTVYDTKTGGFITSVTTESSSDTDQTDSELEEEDGGAEDDHEVEKEQEDPEKLILTQDTYNTLGRGGKKTVSFVTSKEDSRKKMLDNALQSCGLVSSSPQFVSRIEVVNRQGKLVKLRQREGVESSAREEKVEVRVGLTEESPYHVMTNSQYVTAVNFNKKQTDGSSRLSSASTGDSLVTSSLLKFTQHKLGEEEKGRLSGHAAIPEEGQDHHRPYGLNSSKHRRTEEMLSSSVVDSNDELTNLYKTISRKQILSKVQGAEPQIAAHSRPLAKILNMLHGVHNTENMYTSIAEDSVYQSLPTQNSGGDDNNNEREKCREVISACPVLITNILATHTDTFRHAYETGCADCFDYSNSVGYALPYLQSKHVETPGPCKLHKGPFQFPHMDIERAQVIGRYTAKSEQTRYNNTRVICYLTGILLAFLVLIGVIIVLTLMIANREFGIVNQMDF